MRNIIKKGLCLVLVLCMAMVFVGCGNNAKDAQEAKSTVTAFMDAIVNLDMQEAAKYVDNTSAMDSLNFMSISEEYIDKVMEQSPELQPYKEKFMPIVEKSLAKAKEVCSYEIIDEKKDSNGFVYTINLTSPDNSNSVEDYLKNSMEEYTTQEGLMKLMEELLANGKITMSSSEEEIINATFDVLAVKIIDALDKMPFETKTDEIKVTVSKIEDKWLVNTSEANK